MTIDAAALASIAIRLRWAATFNTVARIQLITVDEGIDVASLARGLDALLQAQPLPPPSPERVPVALQVRPFGDLGGLSGDAGRTALVLVAPDRVSQRALDPIRDLLSITGWPLIGVISYPHRRFWQRRSRPLVPEIHPTSSRNALYERFWNRRKSPNGKLAETERNAPLSVVSDTGTAS
jgi:hypothetical protein